MKRIAFFLMIAAVSMSFVLVGCGKDEKPADPDATTNDAKKDAKAAKDKAAPLVEDALMKVVPADALKKVDPAKDALKKADPAKAAAEKAATEKAAAEKAAAEKAAAEKAAAKKAAPAKDTGDKVKHGWTDAKVGDMVKFKMMNNMTQTQKVVKIAPEVVTLEMVMVMNGKAMPANKVDMPRYGKKEDAGKTPPASAKTKKLPNEKLTVGGKELLCEVMEVTMTVGDKTIISKSWTCKEVPGWMVRSDSDMMGKMQTVMELVEYTQK